ncbi:zinc ribbon domain-containing protein [Nonomuraea rubra]
MRRLALLTLVAAALALPLPPPALAHDHPSGISDLVTPALFRVEATSQVKIIMSDPSDDAARVERSFDIPIGTDSGVMINPDGAIVTVGEVVKSEQNPAVYAVNKLFAERYDLDLPVDFSTHAVTNGQRNQQPQQCYPGKIASKTCSLDISTTVKVFRNTLPPDTQGFSASIVQATTPGSPAILMASGLAGTGELPTAPLAAEVPAQAGAAVNVAGFLDRPAADTGDHVDIGHLDQPGTAAEAGHGFADPQKKVDEPSKLGALIDQGLRGGLVIGDKDGRVIGLLVGGGKGAKMIGTREIAAALQKANITPRRGDVDAAFEAALTRFHTRYYGQAVPGFQRVLALSPGHVMATKHLKTSLAKRDGPEDAEANAPESEGTMSTWLIIGAAALIAVALGGALVLWARRSPTSGSTPTPPPDDTAGSAVAVGRPWTPEQAQVSARYCTACGMQMEQGHRFCAYCGHPASI